MMHHSIQGFKISLQFLDFNCGLNYADFNGKHGIQIFCHVNIPSTYSLIGHLYIDLPTAIATGY